jgi:hypothetical protein
VSPACSNCANSLKTVAFVDCADRYGATTREVLAEVPIGQQRSFTASSNAHAYSSTTGMALGLRSAGEALSVAGSVQPVNAHSRRAKQIAWRGVGARQTLT